MNIFLHFSELGRSPYNYSFDLKDETCLPKPHEVRKLAADKSCKPKDPAPKEQALKVYGETLPNEEKQTKNKIMLLFLYARNFFLFI